MRELTSEYNFTAKIRIEATADAGPTESVELAAARLVAATELRAIETAKLVDGYPFTKQVTKESTTVEAIEHCPDARPSAIGIRAVLAYRIDWSGIQAHEAAVKQHLTEQLALTSNGISDAEVTTARRRVEAEPYFRLWIATATD